MGRSEILGEHAANPRRTSEKFGGTVIPTGWCRNCRKCFKVNQIGEECDSCPRDARQLVELHEWKVSALEDRITAQFEDEVRRRGRLTYLDIARSDPVGADELRAQYTVDHSSGAYDWNDQGGNVINYVRTARTKTWGYLYLLFLLMRRCDPRMTEELSRSVVVCSTNESMSAYLWALGLTSKNSQSLPLESGGGEITDSPSASKAPGGEGDGRMTREQWEAELAAEKQKTAQPQTAPVSCSEREATRTDPPTRTNGRVPETAETFN